MEQDVNLKKFSNLFPEYSFLINKIPGRSLPLLSETDWSKVLSLEDIEDLFIFGVGNGEAFFIFDKWLHEKEGRSLIFIEEDLSILKGLLGRENGSKILSDQRTQIYPFSSSQDNDRLWTKLAGQSYLRKTLLIKDPRYNQEQYKKFCRRFEYNQNSILWNAEEFRNFGGGYFYNFYQNLKRLPESFEGVDLFGKAKNVPAFIVGAGPSLKKNGAFLNHVQNKGLIFAGGSALPALKLLGVKPHFGVGIDPNQAQQERIVSYGDADFPYFFRMRINTGALDAVDGPKLFVPGAGGFQTMAWFEKRLGLKNAVLEEGHNVVNFMAAIATEMGCNPIVFVGLDLAFTNGELYAPGIAVDGRFTDLTDEIDIHGNPIKTRWIWVREADWLSRFIQKHPETRYLNATEGGIGIKKMPNTSFLEVIEDLPYDQIPSDLFHFKPLEVSQESIHREVLELKESLERLWHILEEMKKFYAKKNPQKAKAADLVFPGDPYWIERLQKEPAYDAVLKEFENYSTLMVGSSHLLYYISRDGLNPSYAEQVIKLHLFKIDFLIKAIELQLLIIEKFYSLKVRKRKAVQKG